MNRYKTGSEVHVLKETRMYFLIAFLMKYARLIIKALKMLDYSSVF